MAAGLRCFGCPAAAASLCGVGDAVPSLLISAVALACSSFEHAIQPAISAVLQLPTSRATHITQFAPPCTLETRNPSRCKPSQASLSTPLHLHFA